MKKARPLITALAAFIGVETAAQNVLGELIITPSSFSPVDVLQYSQYSYSFTTARAAGMGGAFTSLGGDLVAGN